MPHRSQPIRSRNNKDDYIGDIWCLVPDDGPSSGSDQTLCSPWSPRPCAGADGDARSGVMVGAGASGLQAPDLCVVEASPSDRDGSELSWFRCWDRFRFTGSEFGVDVGFTEEVLLGAGDGREEVSGEELWAERGLGLGLLGV